MSHLQAMQKFKKNHRIESISLSVQKKRVSHSSASISSKFKIKPSGYDGYHSKIQKNLIETPAYSHSRRPSTPILSSNKNSNDDADIQKTCKQYSMLEYLKNSKYPGIDRKYPEKFQSQLIDQKYSPSPDQRLKNIKKNQISINSFQYLFPIGKGGFGKVWKVKEKRTHRQYAVKQMQKAKIIEKNSVTSVMNQRNFLSALSYPFIINMHWAFQTKEDLFIVMDYLDGGNLKYHIKKRKRFEEGQVKFFIANIILGLEYLRQNNIIHRDIKPENLVFDAQGYLRITDLGISKQYRKSIKPEKSGTLGYMAPEVVLKGQYSFNSDYFALGVIGYELMLGKRPYLAKTYTQMYEQILNTSVFINQNDLPFRWSLEAADFLNKLLVKDSQSRLGYHTIDQLKKHKWLQSVNWEKLQQKKTQAPFIPRSIEDHYEVYKAQISEDTQINIEQQEKQQKLLNTKQIQQLFLDFRFDKDKNQNRQQEFACPQTSRQLRNQFYIERE